jgi:hypothetical protein
MTGQVSTIPQREAVQPPRPGVRKGRVNAAKEMVLQVSSRLTLPEFAELAAAIAAELERRRAVGA